MHAGLISVVIPVYNGANYLRQAVDSVLSQTYPDVEIIAIDDGSTDGSSSLLDEYEERVRVLSQPNCGNVGLVRNIGIEHATGEFVAFLDQDDWWEPTKLAEQVGVFHSDAKIGLVHTAVRYFDESLAREVGPQDPSARPQDFVGSCFEALLKGNAICNSSVMLRRTVLDQAGGGCSLLVLGNTVQDYDLWLRVALVSEFGFLAKELTHFRLHNAQGHKDRRAMLREELRLLKRMCSSHATAKSAYRKRSGELMDALAVAHLDAKEPWLARRFFATACMLRPSLRSLGRAIASAAPFPLIQFFRRGSVREFGRTVL